MSTLKRNIVANLIGNGWSAVLSIIFIPLYIHFMGIESYALIGIYITLLGISTVLDFGMSTTINREMARLTSLPDKEQEVVDLVRTMEVLNWIIAVFIGLLILFLAHPIAYHWVKPGRITAETVQQAIYLMGLAMVFQWPFNFYSGGFIGLQRQVLLNIITAGMTTLRTVGAIFVLWSISPTIQAFFVWHIVINVLQIFTLAIFLRTKLPATVKPAVFQLDLIKGVGRFAAGMGSISVLSMIWSQMDKFILSRLLTLETFGYYTLASVAATSFSRVIGPVVTGMFPRLTQLITLGDMERLKQVYHSGCQLMSVLVMPVAFLLAFFPKEIVLLWTQNAVTAQKTYDLVAFLAITTMFNGLSHLPLSLQYALGQTRTVVYAMLVAVIVMAPAIVLSTSRFGVVGATATLMMINMIYTLSLVHLFRGKVLANERRYWYVRDVGIPLIVAVAVMAMGRLLIQGYMSVPVLILSLTAITIGTTAAVAFSAPSVRNWLIANIRTLPQKIFYGI